MALCTKPPSPLVGDIDLSSRTGEVRPEFGDIVTLRPRERASSRTVEPVDGGSNLCAAVTGNGEVMPLMVGSTAGVSIDRECVGLISLR